MLKPPEPPSQEMLVASAIGLAAVGLLSLFFSSQGQWIGVVALVVAFFPIYRLYEMRKKDRDDA